MVGRKNITGRGTTELLWGDPPVDEQMGKGGRGGEKGKGQGQKEEGNRHMQHSCKV